MILPIVLFNKHLIMGGLVVTTQHPYRKLLVNKA